MDDPLHQSWPPFGELLGARRRGAAHIRKNSPCQDALQAAHRQIRGKPVLALAVADGHGGSQYDRSEWGARFAVEESVKLLFEFVVEFSDPRQLLNNLRIDFARILRKNWRDAVLNHDKSLAAPAAEAVDSHTVMRRYGTTLLTLLLQPEWVFAGQLGDGKLVRIQADGTLQELFPADPALLGMETHSLCSEGCDKLWQTAVWSRQARETLLLTTDGLSDSFANNDEFHRFAGSLHALLSEQGTDYIAGQLPHWLDRYSQEGSGDDMTLLLLFPVEDSV
ncbi:MAG: protein phosphatase 2C domain-containing protein [Magnetococcales bacterium]|nr:protein phosphatase 2C domain-containing protein [Magnetococcales bacterium]